MLMFVYLTNKQLNRQIENCSIKLQELLVIVVVYLVTR